MNRWRVGEDTGGKETDRCPLKLPPLQSTASRHVKTARRLPGPLMILTPNRLWNISKVCVMQDKLWKSLP
jgi:hypothetical protein